MLKDGLKPNQLSEIDLLPIPKSGNISLTKNYRGIALSSVVAKLFNKMILYRIQPKLDHYLRNEQNGFRPGRSTESHILALRRLIEGVKAHHRKAVILYVDFKKAFDSIHRGKMLKILKAYDIPPNILKAIAILYDNTRARVISPDGETEYFDITTGILQGDTLAPYLFVIVLDYVMHQTLEGREEELGFQLERRKSRRIGPKVITDLDFADDIALITEEIHQAQEMLDALEREAAKVGLYCNADKTEYQTFNQDLEQNPIFSYQGKQLTVVSNFKYLGAWMESSEKDIKVRKALAWKACHNLQKIWKSKMARKLKVRLFISTVESVLLYGSETWTLTKKLQKQIDGCYTRMLRMALNVTWKDHWTNIQLYQELPKVSEKIQKRRMRIAGHCIRHEEEIASRLILWQSDKGNRKQGRRHMTYIDNLLEDSGMANTSELHTYMTDRDSWRSLVHTLGRPGGRPK